MVRRQEDWPPKGGPERPPRHYFYAAHDYYAHAIELEILLSLTFFIAVNDNSNHNSKLKEVFHKLYILSLVKSK